MNFDQIIDRRNTYCTQWDYIEDRFNSKDIIPFSISDTDFAIPHEIIDTLKHRLEHPIFGYTRWNHEDFKNAIIKHYKERFDCKIISDSIVYSPSVMYSVSALIKILSEENDKVLVLDPMYDAFINVITKNKRELVANPLQNENNYSIDFTLFEKQIKSCKIFLLCSPHNPTGRVFNEKELIKIIDICKKYGVWIISDEIHSDVVLYNHRHSPILKYYNFYDKMCLVNSASKTFNIPGLGASYALIPDNSTRNHFLEYTRQRDFVNSSNIMGMLALICAYQQCHYYIDELNSYIASNMDIIEAFLKENIPMIKFNKPQATYLAWLNLNDLPYSSEEIQSALIKIGKVGIMSGEIYGENGKKFLRMNVGCPKAKLYEGLNGLKQAMLYLQEDVENVK